MPRLLPSSRARFRLRLSPFDIVCAAVAPPFALYLRDAQVLSAQGAPIAFLYCSLSFACALIAFLAFRVSHGISRYFSVQDAVSIITAVVAGGLTTTVVLFTFTRLDGIPRSIPVMQGMILATGLLLTRGAMRLWDREDQQAHALDNSTAEHIIMIGSSRLTALYIRLLQACAPTRHIIAVLDDNQKLFGRTMCGVPVVGKLDQLDAVIDEFAVHGIRVDRVIIGGDDSLLSASAPTEIGQTCAQREITIDFVSNLIGLPPLSVAQSAAAPFVPRATTHSSSKVSPYFHSKRLIDFIIALLAIAFLSPAFVIVSVLVLFDLGAPVVFWQKRIGRNGRSFLLYKFRTLHAPFDRNGQPNGNGEYNTWIGKLLRRLRLDELPQLFNVLVGEMSLIGPRPLLLHDQPVDCHLRLLVRPGITGWAQINGGTLITTEEKGALDDWYVQNASFWLDLRVAIYTLVFLFIGERRIERAVHEATLLQQSNGHAKNEQCKLAEIRDLSAVRRPSSPKLAIGAGVRADQRRLANWLD
jgi:lipopolysaccharide/colanic/teichoic acid biosynthesis glycosyltransferase